MNEIRSKIILVDDSIANLTQGREMLKFYYEVIPAPSAAKMFEILRKVTPDLILLDINMPEMNGYEAIKILKESKNYIDIPVMFLTARDDEGSESTGFDMGAVDYITKPFSAPLLIKRIENHLALIRNMKDLKASKAELKNYAENLEDMVREKTEEIHDLQNAVIATVADLIEFRDKSTGGHINRTQNYLRALVNELVKRRTYEAEMSDWDMELMLLSAQLHDVGKIAITDQILNKPGKLTFEEFEIMKTHVAVGVDAIKTIMEETSKNAFLNHALLIAGAHHEKWDGSGYPAGLSGENIPLEGRLMAIADVYDALISVRPYKTAFTHEESCRIIEEGAGKHFDPVLVAVFQDIEDEFERISMN